MVFKRVISTVLRRRRSSVRADPVEPVKDPCEDFECSLRRNLDLLKSTSLSSSECARYALRWTAGAVEPVDIRTLRRLCGDSNDADSETSARLFCDLFVSGDQLFVSIAIYCHSSQVDHSSEVANCPASECPIDLGQVHRDFNLFCGAADPETLRRVTKQVSKLVKTLLPQALESTSDVATANILAALMLLPAAQEVSNQDSFVEPLLALFSSQRERISGPLGAAFTRCPQSTLTAATFVIQQFLTLRLYSRSSLDAPSVAAVQMLAALHAANSGSAAPAPSETFHNDVINSQDFDLQQDWLRSRQTGRFSFARFPFLYGPAAKARLLRCHAAAEMREGMAASMRSMGGGGLGFAGDRAGLFRGGLGGMRSASPHLQLKVRRGPMLLHDTLSQIRTYLPPDAGQKKALRRPLRVTFVDEQGIDEGGISREFFQLIIKQLMDSRYGLFTCDPETHAFWIRPSCVHQMLAEFELVGIIVGLAIHNGHILSLSLARALYKQLLGSPLCLDDLQEMHADVLNSLKHLLAYDADRVEDDMGLTFQVSHEMDFETITHDLVPNGDSVPVTGQNRREFVDKYVQFLLVERVAPQFEAFERGFSHVCDRKLMEMFRSCPHELEEVVCGTQTLALDELMRSAVYEGGLTADSDVVKWLWEVLESFDEKQKRQFLQFVTGADRAPVGGLGSLIPRFKIMKNGGHSERLPTAHVCFNILLLPQYNTKEWLADRLRKAIENDHGFGLM